jgi:hypothetical protein
VRLSVIVTVVDGGAALERCLAALAAQQDAPPLEVLVPWDASIPAAGGLAARFPAARFLALGAIATQRPAATPAGQHELYDRRRAAGLAAATGDLVAILEDRGVPRPDWAATMARLHGALPHAAIGGAVAHGRTGTLNWAVFFCDFGRYQPPLAAGPRPYVTDVNICYKRRALEVTRTLWAERYHETTVHWALLRAGETLYLSPEPVVEQHRDGLRLGALLRERLGWGRLFAYTRAREVPAARRLVLAALSPILPFVLLARLFRGRLARGRDRGAFLRAAPAILLLLAAWSLGELLGYLTAEA